MLFVLKKTAKNVAVAQFVFIFLSLFCDPRRNPLLMLFVSLVSFWHVDSLSLSFCRPILVPFLRFPSGWFRLLLWHLFLSMPRRPLVFATFFQHYRRSLAFFLSGSPLFVFLARSNPGDTRKPKPKTWHFLSQSPLLQDQFSDENKFECQNVSYFTDRKHCTKNCFGIASLIVNLAKVKQRLTRNINILIPTYYFIFQFNFCFGIFFIIKSVNIQKKVIKQKINVNNENELKSCKNQCKQTKKNLSVHYVFVLFFLSLSCSYNFIAKSELLSNCFYNMKINWGEIKQTIEKKCKHKRNW